MVNTAPTSEIRHQAIPTYDAEFLTTGDHTRLAVADTGDFITKPTYPRQATHLRMQALTQNIRYTIDGTQATAQIGFQLTAGTVITISAPNLGVSVFPEVAGAIIQYQWLR